MPAPTSSVRSIGDGVGYADGAEDQVLSVLRSAEDVSSGSPELARQIVDWPTRYHFSYQRANLLKPLAVGPGVRVLDVGAGTGVAARYLGEQGATVVALEGSKARAEAAAVRCADLPGVEVMCGTLDDLDPAERFDLVLLIGVLEYSGAAIGGAQGPDAMLDLARGTLAPGGALVVAIENQLGLKYLMGGREDHIGRPWVGIEGYTGPPGVRTWSRQVLSGMLAGHGLAAQRWMAPFPDYKLPAVVLDESLYGQADVGALVDQLVLNPVASHDLPAVRLADAAAAHRVFLDAGLGLDVANSFLVVAGASDPPTRWVARPDALAWMFGGHRRLPWRRTRILTGERTVELVGDSGTRRERWLAQEPGRVRPFYGGRTLGELALGAVRSHDLAGLSDVLHRWSDELDRVAVAVDPSSAGAHPFLPPGSRRGLPDGYLDASPTNFVDSDGHLVLIDDEWRTGHPVELDIARHRALWVLAREVVSLGIEHPWGDTATVDDIVASLAELAGLTIDGETVEAWRAAEIELQELVAGEPRGRLLTGWLDGSLRTLDLRPDVQQVEEMRRLRDEELPRLNATIAEQTAQVASLTHEREVLVGQREEFLGQREHFRGLMIEQAAEIERLRTLRGFVADALRRRPRVRRVLASVKRVVRRDTPEPPPT